jgi:hypothetical protein
LAYIPTVGINGLGDVQKRLEGENRWMELLKKSLEQNESD